ncbi:MAG TPA: DUF86 domain-containing protein [Bacteroidales bacterium]|nr:DUF86 domain-containing protein [Bacteroidales bacterium]HSA42886.1 DUF86 domain-containing protein [Bacteroidales bacterium]
MNEKVLKSLFDIKIAMEEIDSFFPSGKLSLADYKSKLLLKRAVERNLEIIGEAMNRILKENPHFPIGSAVRIIGLRNQIIHGYDSVSDENIWAILVKHLPTLRREVEEIIENSGHGINTANI